MHKVTNLNRYEMKLIEEYIKNVDRLRIRLKIRRWEIMDNPIEDNPGAGKSNLPGDPVNSEVTLYLTDDYYMNMSKIIKSIEHVYESSDEEVQTIFRLKYWEPELGLETWEEIAKHLHYSKTNILRVRERYLKEIAERIDFINSDF